MSSNDFITTTAEVVGRRSEGLYEVRIPIGKTVLGFVETRDAQLEEEIEVGGTVRMQFQYDDFSRARIVGVERPL